MKYIQNVVKEIEVIETYLSGKGIGTVSFGYDEEGIQMVVPFVYLDKNIYLLFGGVDDKEELMKEDTKVYFSVSGQYHSGERQEGFEFYRIMVSGILRTVKEAKTSGSVLQAFITKYYTNSEKVSQEDIRTLPKILMVDTEEINAAQVVFSLS